MKLWKMFAGAATMALVAAAPVEMAWASNGTAMAAAATSQAQQPQTRPVLLISVDGLSPDSLFEADRLGLKIPTLRRLMREGAMARRVINVNPTVTNPNHTTMVTGVSPRTHGVFNNRPFVASAKLPAGYRDYAAIQTPTLWSAAKEAGLGTASLYWPVTRDAPHIDANILDGSAYDDDKITRDAISIMERDKPELMTVHYVSYDSAQHRHGPNTADAHAVLEHVDANVGRLIDAHAQHYQSPIVVLVSDHGFHQVRHRVHLNSAFVDAGLITLDDQADNGIGDWRAFAWYVGGMAMVVLKDPTNDAMRREVDSFLAGLAARDDAGIARIYTASELKGRGLSQQAQYVIALKTGYHMGNNMRGPLRVDFTGGAHGAFTDAKLRPDMHAALIIAGDGVAAGQDLGVVDLRQVAPTVAGFLGVELPDAEAAPLQVVTD